MPALGKPLDGQATGALLQVAANGEHTLRSDHREADQANGRSAEDHHRAVLKIY